MALAIILGLAAIAASWFINYLWEKWTSKKGTEQALKDSKIPEQIKQQGLDLEQLKSESKNNLESTQKTQEGIKEIKENIKHLIQQSSNQEHSR